jgi:membrane-associated phospholipid phosphatase
MAMLERRTGTTAHTVTRTSTLARAFVLLSALFTWLGIFVANRPLPPNALVDLDRRLRTARNVEALTTVRALGSPLAIVVLGLIAAALVWCWWHRADLAVLFLVAPLLAGLVQLAVRQQIDRTLPRSAALQGAYGYGFPSGHTAGVAALGAAAVLVVIELPVARRVRSCVIAGASIVVTGVASSNVVLGAHRSLDVVGGVLLGAAAALAAALVGRLALNGRRRSTGSPSRRLRAEPGLHWISGPRRASVPRRERSTARPSPQ